MRRILPEGIDARTKALCRRLHFETGMPRMELLGEAWLAVHDRRRIRLAEALVEDESPERHEEMPQDVHDEECHYDDLALLLEDALRRAGPREDLILRSSYGMGMKTCKSDETARRLKISTARVNQLHKQGLKRTKDSLINMLRGAASEQPDDWRKRIYIDEAMAVRIRIAEAAAYDRLYRTTRRWRAHIALAPLVETGVLSLRNIIPLLPIDGAAVPTVDQTPLFRRKLMKRIKMGVVGGHMEIGVDDDGSVLTIDIRELKAGEMQYEATKTGGKYRINQTIPETLLLALPGMPLSAIIGHEMIPNGIMIREIFCDESCTSYTVDKCHVDVEPRMEGGRRESDIVYLP